MQILIGLFVLITMNVHAAENTYNPYEDQFVEPLLAPGEIEKHMKNTGIFDDFVIWAVRKNIEDVYKDMKPLVQEYMKEKTIGDLVLKIMLQRNPDTIGEPLKNLFVQRKLREDTYDPYKDPLVLHLVAPSKQRASTKKNEFDFQLPFLPQFLGKLSNERRSDMTQDV